MACVRRRGCGLATFDNMNSRQNFKFEICANGVESCVAAQDGGADRVELCAGIPEGGTTPSYGEIKVARRLLRSTRLHVIIRPRGGDFVYNELEAERMLEDIAVCRQLGVDGVVFGCLNADGTVDETLCRRLLDACGGLSVTFHRAFDRCRNPETALLRLADMGFDRVLTSGQQPTALQGTALLARLQKLAAGRIALLAGCGVNEDNIASIYAQTGIREYHFSARVKVRGGMEYINPDVYMGDKNADETLLDYTSAARVRATIDSLCRGL